jgi:heme-degrading monooxygenase HmoA
MILETAILSIRPGQSQAFEAAMAQARPLIAATPGFQRIEVRPCVETADRYLLLVWWDTLEAHAIGFRQSDGYEPWRQLLHHFYEPFPLVEHYAAPL